MRKMFKTVMMVLFFLPIQYAFVTLITSVTMGQCIVFEARN